MILNGKMHGEHALFCNAVVSEKVHNPEKGTEGKEGHKAESFRVGLAFMGGESVIFLRGKDAKQNFDLSPDVGAACDVICEIERYTGQDGKERMSLGTPQFHPAGSVRVVNVATATPLTAETVPLRRAG